MWILDNQLMERPKNHQNQTVPSPLTLETKRGHHSDDLNILVQWSLMFQLFVCYKNSACSRPA